MNNKPLLPPPSADWGRSISDLVNEVDTQADSLAADVHTRFTGANIMAQSLVGQTQMIDSAISNSQPVFIQSTTVNGLIIGPDPAPVVKATVVFNTPPGYNAVMVQAYGSTFAQRVASETVGTTYPLESQIRVISNGSEDGPIEISPNQENDGIRVMMGRATYYTFRPNIGSSVTIQLLLRNPGTAVLNNGANMANLSAMVNFYKGEVLKPPA